jgi:hypothetical protein
MSLDKAMKNLKFDKRLTEWYINNGQLTRDELEAHLKTLPDMGHNVSMGDASSDDDVEETAPEQH